MNEEYRKAILNEVMETRLFQYVPAMDKPRTLEFRRDGTFGMGAIDLTRWEVFYDPRVHKIQLRVYRGTIPIAICELDSRGIWSGRDRTSHGEVQFRPILKGKNKWLNLADPLKFDRVKLDETFQYEEPLPEQDELLDWDIAEHIKAPKGINAIAIAAFDRPLYFQRTVHSIAQNPESVHWPVYIFLDHAEKDVVDMQEAAAKGLLPKCIIVKRPRNVGCGRNLIDIRRQLFENVGYERVWLFEDDMIISPDYIGLTARLFDWANEKYDNIGAVQGWNWCTLNANAKYTRLDVVQPTVTNWWGYVMSRAAWLSISNRMSIYERSFLNCEYTKRPHRSILKWFNLCRAMPQKELGRRRFRPGEVFNEAYDNLMAGPPTGQDAATTVLFHQEGWFRLCTEVNRGLYIGKEGMNMTPSRWTKYGYGGIHYEQYEEDYLIDEFRFDEEVPKTEMEVIRGMKHIDHTGVRNVSEDVYVS